jgi:hypothetical protein
VGVQRKTRGRRAVEVLACGFGGEAVGLGPKGGGRQNRRAPSRGWRDDWMDSGGGARGKEFCICGIIWISDLILIPI